MNELVGFLLARIAEDEAVARTAPGDHVWECDPHHNRPEFAQVVSSDGALASGALTPDAQHIARWDPARVLAECEAKRRIIELHKPWGFTYSGGEGCARCVSPDDYTVTALPDEEGFPCMTIRLVALPYADRPGFREEWRA